MKVQILTSLVCRETGGHMAGDVVDMPDGADWVEVGLARAVKPPKKKAAPKKKTVANKALTE